MNEGTNEGRDHERAKATNAGVVPSFSASSEHFLLDSSTHLCQSSLVLSSRVQELFGNLLLPRECPAGGLSRCLPPNSVSDAYEAQNQLLWALGT